MLEKISEPKFAYKKFTMYYLQIPNGWQEIVGQLFVLQGLVQFAVAHPLVLLQSSVSHPCVSAQIPTG